MEGDVERKRKEEEEEKLTRDDTFELSASSESPERFLVRRDDVLSSTGVLQPRVFGTNTLPSKSKRERKGETIRMQVGEASVEMDTGRRK